MITFHIHSFFGCYQRSLKRINAIELKPIPPTRIVNTMVKSSSSPLIFNGMQIDELSVFKNARVLKSMLLSKESLTMILARDAERLSTANPLVKFVLDYSTWLYPHPFEELVPRKRSQD